MLRYIDKKLFLTEQYKKLGLNEKQLVIILLCIRNDVTFKLDYDKIQEVMGIDAIEVTKELSNLFQSNLLSVTLNKVNNEHVEVIDCSKLFEEPKEEATINAFADIEYTFGKSLSSKEVEVISKWISTNQYEYKDILEAFGIAAINNAKNINYVEKVLENNLLNKTSKDIKPLSMEYNWLEDEG